MNKTFLLAIALIVCLSANAQPQKIIGGSNATEGQFPWMACIYLLGEPGCAGVLVHPEWVLTAAHCLFDDDLSFFSVRINSVDAYHKLNPDGGEERNISEVHIHPGFGFDEQVGEFVDLALWRLSEPVTTIAPINLPVEEDPELLYESWRPKHIAGWGLALIDGEYTNPDILQWVESTVYDFEMCETSVGHAISDDFFCIGFTVDQTPSGAATGDSGGPSWIYDDEGNAILTGIVHGALWDYTDVDQPGLFVKVQHQLDWIESVVNGTPASVANAAHNSRLRVATLPENLHLYLDQHAGPVEVSLWNIQGVKIMEQKSESLPGNPIPLKVSHLASGCYIVQLATHTGHHYSEKVVVMKH